jgi:hypothetical protein
MRGNHAQQTSSNRVFRGQVSLCVLDIEVAFSPFLQSLCSIFFLLLLSKHPPTALCHGHLFPYDSYSQDLRELVKEDLKWKFDRTSALSKVRSFVELVK